MSTPDDLAVHRVGPDEAATYAQVARETFVDTYGASSDPAELATHLQLNFGEALQRQELEAPDAAVYAVTTSDGTWLGFIALAPDPAPDCVQAARPIHLQRIYVTKAAQGRGAGRRLVETAVAHARSTGHDALWLKVWEENHGAHRFYERTGWTHVGTAPFKFGAHWEDDRVMFRRV
ncbi:MAG: hypothetical protein RL139_1463 [Gemmatimonadota bacterium]|jgi:GNAT superfamily N-acetyltransferase